PRPEVPRRQRRRLPAHGADASRPPEGRRRARIRAQRRGHLQVRSRERGLHRLRLRRNDTDVLPASRRRGLFRAAEEPLARGSMSAEAVRDFLRSRGCPEPVVSAGLAGLIEDWDRIVGEIETGYRLGLDDYLNDLDGRELIAAALASVPKILTPALRRKLDAADQRARAALVPAGRCLWG